MADRLDLSAIQWDQPAVATEKTPSFRGAVAGAEATATEGVKAGLKPGTEAATARQVAAIPTPAAYEQLSALQAKLQGTQKQLNRAETLYNQALKGKEPGRVAREYFPSAFGGDPVAQKVKQFNTAASQLYSLASQITRTPGEGAQDRMEFGQKLEAFKPSSDDSDAQIEEKLNGLRDFINSQLQFVSGRIGEVKRPTPNINRAKAMMGAQSGAKVIKFDRFGNRI
jgi:uncharacterized phage infection (PIP) family protein YhgE